MKEYKLTVSCARYVRGIYYFMTRERAENEGKIWLRKGYHCTIEEVEI